MSNGTDAYAWSGPASECRRDAQSIIDDSDEVWELMIDRDDEMVWRSDANEEIRIGRL